VTKLLLRTWFLAICIISQATTGVSSLALKRQLGVDYRTAWLLHHKLLHAIAKAKAHQPLQGQGLMDDANMGGKRPEAPGRSSPKKAPIVAAVSPNDEGRPVCKKVAAIAAFTTEAIKSWAIANSSSGRDLRSDGLTCFAGVIDVGCAHSFIVVV
jgi:hypothetical protein